jgi:hypothetical protein
MGATFRRLVFMCRKRALVATVLAPALLLLANSAFAADKVKPAPEAPKAAVEAPPPAR